MANKMLIDASHPEETRVVVSRGNRVEEFDFESASKRQLRGNIYLAKVTRVEPSLQAAFVDYGGNRHGFLAFAEIHPDYYQIPVADRQALLEDEARAHAEEDDDERTQRRSRRHQRGESRRDASGESVSEDAPDEATEADASEDTADGTVDGHADEPGEAPDEAASSDDVAHASEDQPAAADLTSAAHVSVLGEDGDTDHQPGAAPAVSAQEHDSDAPQDGFDAGHDAPAPEDEGETTDHDAHAGGSHAGEPSDGDEATDEEHGVEQAPRATEPVEHMGGDAMEELPQRRPRSRRQYKIQEVIKRRQVLLIQVVKEERGNKGAALTTYLSLAGRYSVLMPNTARGGGISRKITDATDRKRLKTIAQDLEVPEGMGVILRTAGAARTRAEVKRDFEYLLRVWETVRELTLKSSAPQLTYEEGSLIKRSIRDLYNKDIDEVIVAGEDGYKEAKDFMRMLMPSHAKNVKLYRDPQPLFAKSGAEAQLDAMFSNQVTLKSGGYLVINQTEALVAIDVNSGRSTREHNIEDTALRTNLEAADEVARQLRLRDLAGLIVVDFIDMEEGRNNRAVERRMKDALKNDRARIQVGHISHFGLLEMSRQRIRTGVLEGSTVICAHCAGAGTVRSTASIALHVLRLLEDALIRSATHNLTVRTRTVVALYVLNQKRPTLRGLEERFGVTITVAADDSLTGVTYHALDRGEPAMQPAPVERADLVRIDSVLPAEEEDEVFEDEADETEEADIEGDANGRARQGERSRERGGERAASDAEGDGSRRRKRRRRRRGGGERDENERGSGEREGNERGMRTGDGEQPADDGLHVIAEAGGDFHADMGTSGEDAQGNGETRGFDGDVRDGNRDPRKRRRSRRGGRRDRGDERFGGEAGVSGDRAADQAANHAAMDHEMPVSDPAGSGAVHAQASGGAWRQSDDDAMAHDTGGHDAAPGAPALDAAAVAAARDHADAAADGIGTETPSPAVDPPTPRPRAQPLPEATVDPDQPRKSGWWSRAKATFGG